MPSPLVKLVVFVPESHTDIVREAMGNAGAGKIGNYDFCTFSTKGVGRFKPNDKANPHIGEVGKLEEVMEERIEKVCLRELLAERIFNGLSKDGQVEGPIGDGPWGTLAGMFRDKYGIEWIVEYNPNK